MNPRTSRSISIQSRSILPFTIRFARIWRKAGSGKSQRIPKFLFTAKLWQKFTHESGATAEDEKSIRAGFDVLQDAGRLGAVLAQFPFSFHNTPENLEYIKRITMKFQDYPLVVEVRHSSWSGKQLDHLLRERRVGFCNIDQPVIDRSILPAERVTSPSAMSDCTAPL